MEKDERTSSIGPAGVMARYSFLVRLLPPLLHPVYPGALTSPFHSLTWEKASRRRKPVLTPCGPEATLIVTFIFQHNYYAFA